MKKRLKFLKASVVFFVSIYKRKKNNQFAAGYFCFAKAFRRRFSSSPNPSIRQIENWEEIFCCFADSILAKEKDKTVACATYNINEVLLY